MTPSDLEAVKRALEGVNTLPAGETVAMMVPAQLYNDIQIALSILRPIAEGKSVVVPVEPTEAMLMAGIAHRHDQTVPEAWSLATVNIYRAMLTAAQGK